MPEVIRRIEKKKRKSSKLIKRVSYTVVWCAVITGIVARDNIELLLRNILSTSTYNFLGEHATIICLILLFALLFVLGWRRLIWWVLCFLAFPFLVLLWYLPKGGFVTIYRLPSSAGKFLSFMKTLKYKSLYFILMLLSSYIVLVQSIGSAVSLAMAVLLLLLVLHYIKRFYSIINPVGALTSLQEYLNGAWEKAKTDNLAKKIAAVRALDDSTKEYVSTRRDCLSQLRFYKAVFHSIAALLERLQANGVVLCYFVFAVGFTLTLTIVVFALEYSALQYILPDSFTNLSSVDAMECLYFSYNTMFTINFGSIIPVTGLAKLLVSVQFFFGLLLGVILFLVFTTVTVERYKQHHDDLVAKLFTEENQIDKLIRDNFPGEV